MTAAQSGTLDLLCCPNCRSDISRTDGDLYCVNAACSASERPFPTVAGKPVLLDPGNSIFGPGDVDEMTRTAPSQRKQLTMTGLSRLARQFLPKNTVAEGNAARFLGLLRDRSAKPRILIVGGGTRGQGTDALWVARDVERSSFDVFASANVDYVADAHSIPQKAGSFDGVWIQAVLEHVLDPSRVVAEIYRVLDDDGLIYAETPFMQQVHEAAFDFFRTTHSAHRWLLRDFSEVASGPVGGPGTTTIWALRYLARAVSGRESIGRITAALFFWLRWLDGFGNERHRLDSASGVFFLGRKSATALDARSLPGYYHARK